MEDILRKIVHEKGLKIEESSDDLFNWVFCYYLDKEGGKIEDYYLFVFFDLAEVRKEYELTEGLGAFLNSISIRFIESQKTNKKLSTIDFSLITVVRVPENEKLERLFSMEEDSYVIKKYLLPYNVAQRNELDKRITGNVPILTELKRLSLVNSSLLKNASDAPWYQLLLNIYIKLPFLNLNFLEEDKEDFQDIKENIRKSLSDEQQELRSKILESQDPEEFIDMILSEQKGNGAV